MSAARWVGGIVSAVVVAAWCYDPGVSEDEKKSLTVAIYSDAASPAIKEVGNVGGRLVRMALAPLRGFVWSYERIEEWIEKEVGKRLEGIPAERIQGPAPEVVVPALMAVAYTQAEELRAMFAALLAKSMDSATAKDVHPSFVEVIKQLTPYEAKILARLTDEPVRFYDLFSIPTEGGGWYSKQLEEAGVTELFEPADQVSHSRAEFDLAISSLERAGLISVDLGSRVSVNPGHPGNGRALNEAVEKTGKQTLHFVSQIRELTVTPFGKSFQVCCLDRPAPTAAAPAPSPAPPPPPR